MFHCFAPHSSPHQQKFPRARGVPHRRHFLLAKTVWSGHGGPGLHDGLTEVTLPTPILKVPTHLLGRSVLLVEDELLVAWDIEQMLTAAGVRVLGPAASVSSALALLQTNRPGCGDPGSQPAGRAGNARGAPAAGNGRALRALDRLQPPAEQTTRPSQASPIWESRWPRRAAFRCWARSLKPDPAAPSSG